jgi:molybdate transport system substrate-binding protein
LSAVCRRFDIKRQSPCKVKAKGLVRDLPIVAANHPADEDQVTDTDKTASIDVMSTLALRGVLVEIAEDFRARTGLSFAATYKSTNATLALSAQGASADMTIVTREAIDRLAGDGTILAGSTADLARSGVGIAVRAGGVLPEIGTVAAFRQAILAVKSIAFSRQGASGIHFSEVIERLGIAEQIRRKATITDSYVGELVARGEVEMAVQQISELMPVADIDIVGPLPGDLQRISTFAAGIFTRARRPDAARKLIAYLAAPDIGAMLAAKGLESVS